MRGQLSIEFIIVLSGLLLIIATVSMPMYNQARADVEKISKLADAREAAVTLANATNTVYAAGVGSKQTIEYWLPQGVVSVSFVGGTENRLDVRIELNIESDNVVQVSTLLSENEDYVKVSGPIQTSPNYRVRHRTTLRHGYDTENKRSLIVINDQIIESV